MKGFLFPTQEVRFPAFATELERLSVIGLRVIAGVCVAAPLFSYLALKVLPHVFADDPERLARVPAGSQGAGVAQPSSTSLPFMT